MKIKEIYKANDPNRNKYLNMHELKAAYIDIITLMLKSVKNRLWYPWGAERALEVDTPPKIDNNVMEIKQMSSVSCTGYDFCLRKMFFYLMNGFGYLFPIIHCNDDNFGLFGACNME